MFVAEFISYKVYQPASCQLNFGNLMASFRFTPILSLSFQAVSVFAEVGFSKTYKSSVNFTGTHSIRNKTYLHLSRIILSLFKAHAKMT